MGYVVRLGPIRSHRAEVSAPEGRGRRPPFRDDGPPVYPAREDTLLLLPFARVGTGTRFLEIGAGSGLVALEAARSGARVVATDLNPYALGRLRELARVERLDVDPVRTDLARGLGQFDRIVANPPYLPTRPPERDPDRWHNLALDGGHDGCRVTARLIGELDEHLLRSGEAFVLVSSLQSASALRRIRTGWFRRGGKLSVAASRQLEGERLEVWRLTMPGD